MPYAYEIHFYQHCVSIAIDNLVQHEALTLVTSSCLHLQHMPHE